MDNMTLKNFIFEASTNTYASEDKNIRVKQSDSSTTIEYEKDDWKYHDNYFGGEPFGGREVVFYKEKPVWMMVYYGAVVVNEIVPDELYTVLTKALRSSTVDMPYRGPKELVDGEFRYVNELQGEVDNFSGEERIYKGDTLLYVAKYIGGLLDKS
ncbi:MAG: hypothetical protein UR61_C0029G0008 [candidate division WS6 bacterium GW2011_GWE1_34_7]|uniref:DUF5680 domain-containing protein n=2 Tax=Candidatus Dojkabacteria TaxID=74243 RepID=A0A0G0DQF0_9BACT|nr:MAG: hypothetical protein UR61_C0029G0008 [candidate division WS6 bacterium GW2011_GWE1_34_7]KKP78089.1 MAG: hypothetical protein UR73_C0004G0010 [candidate division WS6 bacterium GW2011_GWF1_35_23]